MDTTSTSLTEREPFIYDPEDYNYLLASQTGSNTQIAETPVLSNYPAHILPASLLLPQDPFFTLNPPKTTVNDIYEQMDQTWFSCPIDRGTMFIKPIAESIWWERIFVWPDSHVGKMKEIIVDTTKLLNNDNNNASLFIQMLTTISNVDKGVHLTTLTRPWDEDTMYYRRYEHGKVMVGWMRSEMPMGEVRGNEIAFEETVEIGQGVEGEDTYIEQETWEG